MDAKPQRPLRSFKVRDENIPPGATYGKAVHQRNKSSPALSTLAQQQGTLKAGARRAVFADLSNTNKGNQASKDDSVITTTKTTLHSLKELPSETDKAAPLLRPAQRPLSVSGLKGLLNNFTSASSTAVSKIPPESLLPSTDLPADSRHVKSKKSTAVFRDLSTQNIAPAKPLENNLALSSTLVDGVVEKPVEPVPTSLPLLPQHPPPQQLPPLPTTYQQRQEPLPKRPNMGSSYPSQTNDHAPPPSSPTKYTWNEIRDQRAMYGLREDDLPHWPGLLDSKQIARLQAGEPLESIVGVVRNDSPPEPPAPSCPYPYWDYDYENAPADPPTPSDGYIEDAEEAALHERYEEYAHDTAVCELSEKYNEYAHAEALCERYHDDGYTTARSLRSRGDYTTGPTTVVLAPKMTAKVELELAAAKKYIQDSKTVEEIEEDECWDTSMVAEYGEEIFGYMRALEERMRPNPFYMDNQTEVQWSMRSVLMDWLVQVHHRFSLLPETLFLCVNYIDRFLSCKVVSLGKLQLVGATAIFVAAKYEEINCPSVSEIQYMVDGGYTVDEILKAERFMLSMLQFELGWPGPMSFLRRISKADDYDLETRTLAKYFLEITIMDERFVACIPSFTAAGAHCLARLMLGKGSWSHAHIYYSNYTYSQLRPLLSAILSCCEDPQKHHSAVFDKYGDKRFKRASLFVQNEMDKGFVLPPAARTSVGTSSSGVALNGQRDWRFGSAPPVEVAAGSGSGGRFL